jgi:1-acyl-sn-glycerol-3-phosphate acyltransferase
MKLQRNYFVAVLRMIALLLWILTMPLVFMLGKGLGIKSHIKLPHIFHRGTCRILGIRVTISGEMSRTRPTLFASNHVSYIDIFVLGFIPAYFIAKSEVAGWPVFGQLARFQNTLFFERKAGKAREQLEVLKAHLQRGNSLTLFAEGTSTDGTHVKAFKSTLFEAANLEQSKLRVAIQPVTVCYTHYNGEKIVDQDLRDYYAWYAKMPFLTHFLNLFPMKKVDAKVHFHPVCYLDQFETRKQCAEHCQKLVSTKLTELVA